MLCTCVDFECVTQRSLDWCISTDEIGSTTEADSCDVIHTHPFVPTTTSEALRSSDISCAANKLDAHVSHVSVVVTYAPDATDAYPVILRNRSLDTQVQLARRAGEHCCPRLGCRTGHVCGRQSCSAYCCGGCKTIGVRATAKMLALRGSW